MNPNYTRTIYNSNNPADPTLNPLAGKRAWGGASAGYPADVNVSLNFAMALAGKTIKVRFRIGTDEGTGAAGWDIDDIAFGGITNTPFPSLVDNATRACGDAGVPNPPEGGTPDSGTTGAGGGSSDGGTTTSGGGGGNPTGGTAGSASGNPTSGGSNPSGAGGASSSSSSATTGGGPGGDDGGCSCSTPGGTRTSGFAHALAMLGALAFLRRRRTSR